MAESIPPTPRPLNGSIRPATAVIIIITVITATLILAHIVVVTTAVPLA